MGYTQFTVDNLEALIAAYNPKSVIDLGAQNMYNQPYLPAPYASDWYKKKGIDYLCIDLNGENNAVQMNLSKDIHFGLFGINQCDMLVDAGTSEHVADEKSNFSWEAIYSCWKIKYDLLKDGGIMYSENPKTGNWPGHGRNYYTVEFYIELAYWAGFSVIGLGEHPACSNYVDGWNVWCSMKKWGNPNFISLDKFKELNLKQS